jgi:hypothetical protein
MMGSGEKAGLGGGGALQIFASIGQKGGGRIPRFKRSKLLMNVKRHKYR